MAWCMRDSYKLIPLWKILSWDHYCQAALTFIEHNVFMVVNLFLIWNVLLLSVFHNKDYINGYWMWYASPCEYNNELSVRLAYIVHELTHIECEFITHFHTRLVTPLNEFGLHFSSLWEYSLPELI